MAGITVASFTLMATGMAVAAAVIRGRDRRGTDRLGNFWVDLTRSLLYDVVPLAAVVSILRAAPSELRFEADGLVIDLSAHLVTIGYKLGMELGHVVFVQASSHNYGHRAQIMDTARR